MVKMLSLFTKHALCEHQGHPARRMIPVPYYSDKTSQYITEMRNAVNLFIGRAFNHIVYFLVFREMMTKMTY